MGAKLPPRERRRILKDSNKPFTDQERADWREFELEKTPEDLELIRLANDASNRLLSEHDRRRLEIPPQNYHVLNEQGWKQLSPGSHDAACRMQDQAVLMRDVLRRDAVLFGLVAYHETLHFKSHQALQRLYPSRDLAPYRAGLKSGLATGAGPIFENLTKPLCKNSRIVSFVNSSRLII